MGANMEETTYSFGYWVLRRRKALDFTRNELATRVGCSAETIKKIEGDERRPSKQIAALLAKALNVLPEDIDKFIRAARGQKSIDTLPLTTQPIQPSLSPTHNLPIQPTPFIGRELELEEVGEHLAKRDYRLVNLVGSGGIGKSRLAIQVAENRAGSYSHGVYFVPFPEVDSDDPLPTTIISMLGIELPGKTHPKQKLLSYLQDKHMLIVLDNFEHLLPATGLLVEILQHTNQVDLLVTSRERMNLQSELVYPISGLAFPPTDHVEDIESYSSVGLFLQNAQRVQPDFKLDEANKTYIARICRLVEGMPLAIELAAAWLPVLSREQITGEIERGLDILKFDVRDLPERQRSMRTVFNASWNLLSSEEQVAIQKLSVFRGGFTLEAATKTFGLLVLTLLVLVHKCWVQPETNGRFHIHVLLRQYVSEHLVTNQGLWFEANQSHSAYFCGILQAKHKNIRNYQQLQTIIEFDTEYQNIEAAWKWAQNQGQINLIEKALVPLCEYYIWRGRINDGEDACRNVAARLDEIYLQADERAIDALKVRVMVLSWQGFLTSDVSSALQIFKTAHTTLNQLAEHSIEPQPQEAFLLFAEGVKVLGADPHKSTQLLTQSSALYARLDDRDMQVEALLWSGFAYFQIGKLDQAQEVIHLSRTFERTESDNFLKSLSLHLQGMVLREKGNLVEAEKANREAVAIAQEYNLHIDEGIYLGTLAHTMLCAGKFQEAKANAESSYSLLLRLGIPPSESICVLANSLIHLDDYDHARHWALKEVENLQSLQDLEMAGYQQNCLGEIALVHNQITAARQHFKESLASMHSHNHRIFSGLPLANLGYLHLSQQEPSKAQPYLSQCIQTTMSIDSSRTALHLLPAIALYEANRGEIERAIEVYAQAIDSPYVKNSQWFEDIAGNHINSLAAGLPPDIVEAARDRGKSLDIWDTLAVWLKAS
jgi:transcriptional regulator with XRE-family HTH domain/tetratricopeptide (TPR) repeat protein